METKLVTLKRVQIACQGVALLGVLVGLGAIVCMVWELTDFFMLQGRLYTMLPEEQLAVLSEEALELPEEVIVPAIVGAVALLGSLLTGLSTLVMTCIPCRKTDCD